MSTWVKATAVFDEAPVDWSPYHDIFENAGCPGTIEETNPPSLSSYFFQDENEEQIKKTLTSELTQAGINDVQFSLVPDESWSDAWKLFFKTRKIGKQFWIVPTWEQKPTVAPNEHLIHLDPGQAFGTGDHATTRLCVCMLEEALEKDDIIADIGSGSGILAIASGMLGASKIFATESETPAYIACKENLNRNQINADVRHTSTIPSDFPKCDLVVSNIVSAVIIRLATDISKICKPNGLWILSGVIPKNFPDVETAATTAGFSLITIREEDGWIGAMFRKN